MFFFLFVVFLKYTNKQPGDRYRLRSRRVFDIGTSLPVGLGISPLPLMGVFNDGLWAFHYVDFPDEIFGHW